jgi:ADP-ribose pyrophosphatase YjhB (NUDIX family)
VVGAWIGATKLARAIVNFLIDVILPRLPARLHRLALRYGRSALMILRRLYYSPRQGCAVIVQNEEGHVLLVRHTYCEPETWMLPAGKMKPKEAPLKAARRELNEEIKCDLVSCALIEFEDTEFWGRRHTTFIVGGLTHVTPEPDLREISEAAFFPLSDLPRSTNLPTLARLERWQLRRSIPIPIPPFVRVEYVRQRFGAG